jgi:hypothetical protein
MAEFAKSRPNDLSQLAVTEQTFAQNSTVGVFSPKDQVTLERFFDLTSRRKYSWETAPNDIRQSVLAASGGG